jgi:uncharacterized protein YcbK (DUF882 family)
MQTIVPVILTLFFLLAGHGVAAERHLSDGRFYHSGDGILELLSRKTGAAFSGRYRRGAGTYDTAAYAAICRVFGAPCASGNRILSLRLIEFIDYLQDHFNSGARITITSGYRSPHYNRSIRKKGALAARASLHQYGMAADLIMEGVDARRIWTFVRRLGFGGTGYYGGETVHLDVGPPRWWDQASSGVGTGISDDNKLIGIVSDFDIYEPGETLALRLIRMTAFPVGVASEFELVRRVGQGQPKAAMPFKPVLAVDSAGACPEFSTIEEATAIRWRLPSDVVKGRYSIRATFCGMFYPHMPKSVVTPAFTVR